MLKDKVKFVVKDNIKYEVRGSEKHGYYVIFGVVGVGENCYSADASLERDGLWYVKFFYDNKVNEEEYVTRFTIEDADRANREGMSFRLAVQYMWKVMKEFCTKKYLEVI